MYIATLIAAPGQLPPALADSLRNAWGGGDVQWLSPDEAAEFALDEVPTNRWDVWKDLQDQGVDLVVQPADGRRKSVLLADMDSTMIYQECIDELAAEAGVGDQVATITARAMNGELDFEGALTERVGLLAGLPVGTIETVWTNRITLRRGARELVQTMRANGAFTALVSGGFTEFTSRVAEACGFDMNRANVLDQADGKLTGKVAGDILGREAKVATLDEICATRALTSADVLAVGDGANDLGMLARAGSGVALHAKPVVAAQCDLRISFGDLTALLYLQGYGRDDFVT